jgi:hypothetical protein
MRGSPIVNGFVNGKACRGGARSVVIAKRLEPALAGKEEAIFAAIIDFDTGFGYQKRGGNWNTTTEKLKSLSSLQKYAHRRFCLNTKH